MTKTEDSKVKFPIVREKAKSKLSGALHNTKKPFQPKLSTEEHEQILAQTSIRREVMSMASYNMIVSKIKDTITNTPLSTDSTITKEEVKTTYNLIKKLQSIVDPSSQNTFPLYFHLDCTGKIAHELACELNEKDSNLNPEELQVLGLLHDIGRYFTHAYYANDQMAYNFLKDIGLRKDLLCRLIPPGVVLQHWNHLMIPHEF